MNYETTSRDIFNLISYNLSMEDVWNQCQTDLKRKCNDDFWKKQINYRFPRLNVPGNPKKHFGNIIGFLKKHGGKTWYIEFSEQLVEVLQKGFDPCVYDKIKISVMKQVPDSEYKEMGYYESNVEYEKCQDRTCVIAKSETPVIPGQKIWIATSWNEDYLSSGMVFDSLERAKKYLIKQVEIWYDSDRKHAIQDLKRFQDSDLEEMVRVSKTDEHIKSIEKKGCWNYFDARAFRIFEHTIEE